MQVHLELPGTVVLQFLLESLTDSDNGHHGHHDRCYAPSLLAASHRYLPLLPFSSGHLSDEYKYKYCFAPKKLVALLFPTHCRDLHSLLPDQFLVRQKS